MLSSNFKMPSIHKWLEGCLNCHEKYLARNIIVIRTVCQLFKKLYHMLQPEKSNGYVNFNESGTIITVENCFIVAVRECHRWLSCGKNKAWTLKWNFVEFLGCIFWFRVNYCRNFLGMVQEFIQFIYQCKENVVFIWACQSHAKSAAYVIILCT